MSTSRVNSRSYSASQTGIPTLHAPLHPAATRAPPLVFGKERIAAGHGPEARGSEPVSAGRVGLVEVMNEVDRLRSQVEQVTATLAVQKRLH